jgi:protein-S-isoprenylcysteine O-methyltransferase Ste14
MMPNAIMAATAMPTSVIIQAVVFVILAAVALFASAGTLAITAFWVYLGIYVIVCVVSLAIIDPDLIRERMRPGGKPLPRALHLVGLIPVLHWIVAGLDRGRFHWSEVPAALQVIGLLGVACGFALFLWAMYVNRFFSSVARIQAERGQHVIASGPYRYVRHPGYAAAIIFFLTSGMALGSWVAAGVLVVLALPPLLWRTVVEDRLLQAELAGYRDYAARVRWRLLPGIW